MNSLTKIESELSLAKSQLSAFNSRHTASSATRTRAHLLVISKECNALRKAILAESKTSKASRAEKKKTKKVAPEQQEPVDAEEPDVTA